MSNISRVGRPTPVAPPGYVSITDAMAQTGCTYGVVYRHVRAQLVRSLQEDDGAPIFLWSGDLPKIHKHEPPPDRERIPVQLAPDRARHRAWSRAAKARKVTVTQLGYDLMDHAAGYTPKE